MRKSTFRSSVYYFDVAGALVSALVLIGFAAPVSQPGAASHWIDRLALGGFAAAAAGLVVLRARAYTQRTPWIIGVFSVAAIAALTTVFSRWYTVWFILGLVAGLVVLAIGSITRRKTISEPPSRHDAMILFALSGGVLSALILLEVLVRLSSGLLSPEIQQLLRANPGQYGVAHPYIGHLHTPNSSFVVTGRDFRAVHHIDPVGFRNPWPWPDPPIDIAVVGDSVAFGYGVADNESWPAVLARARPGTKLVNLSVVGAGPQQYLRVFETFGVQLRPKLLLVGLWAGNDFGDARLFRDWQLSGAGGNDMVWRDFGTRERATLSLRHPVVTTGELFRRYAYPVLRRSSAYNLIWAIRGGWDRHSSRSSIMLPFPDGSRLELSPDGLRDVAAIARPETEEFRLLFDALATLWAASRRENIRMLIVLQPFREEVYLPGIDPDTPDPTRALRDAFDAAGIAYLDLAPVFRDHARAGECLYRELDGHPNAAGYALIAELVLASLQQSDNEFGRTRRN